LVAAALAAVAGRIAASPVSDGGWRAGVVFALVGGVVGTAVYAVLAWLLAWLLAWRLVGQDVRALVRRRGRV
jgi:hypothetical protein